MSDKKDVRNLIAKRNPLERPKIEPVDLYSVPSAEPEAKPEVVRDKPRVESRASTPDSAPSRAVVEEDVVKPYSTYLRVSLVEGIKLRAFKRHRKDREIVSEAIEEYFRNHPLD